MNTAILRLVADVPRHVEARSALLGGRAEVFGQSPRGAVVLDISTGLVSLIGEADPRAAEHAVSRVAGEATIIGDAALRPPLPGWTRELATLYRIEETPRFEPSATRLVCFEELAAFHLPAELLDELSRVKGYAPLAATFAAGAPVSFCYAVETESLWDVSIDTLENHRGQGYAEICAAWMIRHQAALGRRAVWGAVDSNTASHRVAAKLGFAPVDRIAVWEAPEVTRTSTAEARNTAAPTGRP